ncbi:TrbG/VirB9 family P-type conjugative transfer protein [Massilia sp. GER05]|uniref:TrbG/VirB9 family P-type conjugative transfer protein n=1 Tax=Massilia sp. GER05 TaxID=3394605 RepID=UPI003F82F3ED
MNKRFIFGLVTLVVTATVHAAQLPEAGKKDARIRFATYDPYDVVTIYTRDGLETHIVFDHDEKIVDMTGGDVDAWGVATKYSRDGLFIKPAGILPDANLHVVTTRRTYTFDLKRARKDKGEVGFMTVYFRYPAAEHAASAEPSAAEQARALLDASPPVANRRYSVQGSSELAPVEAWDDGRTTFLRFRATGSVPAVYSVRSGEDALEQIESPVMKDDVMQVPGVHRKLVMRIGREVACVFNDGFDQDARRPATSTASAQVDRILKGATK